MTSHPSVEAASEAAALDLLGLVKKPAPPDPVDVKKAARASLAEGFDTGLGYRLAAAEYDQAQFTKMLVLVSTALSVGAMQPQDLQTIAAADGSEVAHDTIRMRDICAQVVVKEITAAADGGAEHIVGHAVAGITAYDVHGPVGAGRDVAAEVSA